MKKITTLFAALLATIALSAQWSTIYQDAAKLYDDIDFPTNQDGFVLGHYNSGNCFILKTSDAGVNWTEIVLPGGSFNQLSMYSATSGYVCRGGTPGVLLRTNDGFATTVSNLLDASYGTIGLEAMTDSSGFFMNNDSHFRSFNNYGASFAPVMDTLFGNGGFSVADESTVYVGNGIHLEKTTDAGATWFCVNSNLPDYAQIGIRFINADTGYYIGTSYGIWRTMDGGLSFQNVNTYNYAYAQVAANGPYCVSINGSGTIQWSSDYGQTWAMEFINMNYSTCASVTTGGDCYVANSASGKIQKRQAPLAVADAAAEALSVFPNPATNNFTVAIPVRDKEKSSIVVYNGLGQPILARLLEAGEVQATFNTESWPAGMYQVQVTCGVNVFSKALVVQH